MIVNADVNKHPYKVTKHIKEEVFGVGRLSPGETAKKDTDLVNYLHGDKTINCHMGLLHHFCADRIVALVGSPNLCIAIMKKERML